MKLAVRSLPKGMFNRARSSAIAQRCHTVADTGRSDRVVRYFRGTFDPFCLSIWRLTIWVPLVPGDDFVSGDGAAVLMNSLPDIPKRGALSLGTVREHLSSFIVPEEVEYLCSCGSFCGHQAG